jgi:chromosomal replication initiator protein
MVEAELATMWQTITSKIGSDPRITPNLKGHLDLAVPKGVLGDTLYVEVPNDTTRNMIQQRLRELLLEALAEAAGIASKSQVQL